MLRSGSPVSEMVNTPVPDWREMWNLIILYAHPTTLSTYRRACFKWLIFLLSRALYLYAPPCLDCLRFQPQSWSSLLHLRSWLPSLAYTSSICFVRRTHQLLYTLHLLHPIDTQSLTPGGATHMRCSEARAEALIGCWSCTSLQHLWSYQNVYWLVTVHTHGDFFFSWRCILLIKDKSG